MRRGEVWWADLAPSQGSRPVLLISRDEAYVIRTQVTVAFITTRVRNIPAEVPLGPTDGLPRPCVVNLDNINTIERSALRRRITMLRLVKLHAVDAAIRFALGLTV